MISRRIIELIELALKDYVLTDRERQVIVAEALDEGVSWEEINRYIDQRLKHMADNMPKEMLKRCPVCGAQIPLISNTCKFCKSELQPSAKNIIEPSAKTIIENENRKTERERENMAKCPDCGAPFPLLGRICGFCGHIFHDLPDHQDNIITLQRRLSSEINSINNIKINIKDIYYYQHPVLVGLMAIPFMVMGVRGSDFWLVLTIVALLYGLIKGAIIHSKKSPAKQAADQLSLAKIKYNSYARQVDTLYGNDREAQDMLRKLKKVMDYKIQQKTIANLAILMVFGFVFTVLIASGFSMATSKENRDYKFNKYQHERIYYLLSKEFKLSRIESKSKELKGIVATDCAIMKTELDINNVKTKLIDKNTPLRLKLYNVRIINDKPIERDSIKMVVHLYDKDKNELTSGGKYNGVVMQCTDTTKLLGDRYYTFTSINNYKQSIKDDLLTFSARYFSIEIDKQK